MTAERRPGQDVVVFADVKHAGVPTLDGGIKIEFICEGSMMMHGRRKQGGEEAKRQYKRMNEPLPPISSFFHFFLSFLCFTPHSVILSFPFLLSIHPFHSLLLSLSVFFLPFFRFSCASLPFPLVLLSLVIVSFWSVLLPYCNPSLFLFHSASVSPLFRFSWSSACALYLCLLDGCVFFVFFSSGMWGNKTKMFHVWFHTRFIEVEEDRGTAMIEIPKSGIDKACKDRKHKIYDPTLTVRIQLMEQH